MTREVCISTEAGEFVAHFSERGLARIDFPDRKQVGGRSELRIQKPFCSQLSTRTPLNSLAFSPEFGHWAELAANALRAALAGKPVGGLPPFDWRGATEFQQSIWRALLRIPSGHTSTYSGLAAAAGHPRAVRAAGSACGANPIPVLVPCHRVVASGGRLGGFSAGLEWKRRLLALEGVEFPQLREVLS
jgi:O-6-methylguanine DNA methyltransferase